MHTMEAPAARAPRRAYARAAAGLWPVWTGVWLALHLLFASGGGLASISGAGFCLLGALGVFLRAVATRLDSLAAPPRARPARVSGIEEGIPPGAEPTLTGHDGDRGLPLGDDEFSQPPVAGQPAPAPTPTAADDDDAPPAADEPLPLGDDEFPDEALALVCSFLGLRELGRLACVARRFTEPTLTEPGGAKLLSPIEEGARLQLASVAGDGGSGGGGASGGAAAVRLADETWMRALWRVQYRLLFTSCGPTVALSEEGALRLRAAGRAAAATRCLARRGGTRAGSHSLGSWLPELQRVRGVRAVLSVRSSPLSHIPAACRTLFCA
eukprot:COSAG04_NODE_3734_length_2576_cov_1.193783_1_plen_325_part_10